LLTAYPSTKGKKMTEKNYKVMSEDDRTRPYEKGDKERFKLWYWALKLPGRTLEQTLAEEVALYFGKTVDEVVDFWYDSTEKLRDEWMEQDPKTQEQIDAFYNKTTTYIYELSYWHTLHMNLGLIENVRSLQWALKRPGRHYLDFGGGTGSNIILFNKHGFNCTLADISTSLLDFARFRFERRDIDPQIIDTKTGVLPDETYDFVTAVEILEHVPNPLEIMRTLVKATKPGGIIVAWIPFFADELRPQHLVTDIDIADKFVEDLGLREIWREDRMMIRYYQKPS
jgi:ubiquinone/menaquinone biosynthesis C-methylase UbiE